MKKLHPSAQFKKDYKRYRHDSQKKEALKDVLDLLVNEQPIPQKYTPYTQGRLQRLYGMSHRE